MTSQPPSSSSPTLIHNHHPLLNSPSSSDLLLLRHLSTLPSGFDRPSLVSLRFHNLILPHLPHPPLPPASFEPSHQLSALFKDHLPHRKYLWSFILGLQTQFISTNDPDRWTTLPPHRDERQVDLDVNRSFVYYPSNISSSQKAYLRQRLQKTIVKVLRTFPSLNYFQGYHDIVSIFLLNLVDLDQQSGGLKASQAEGDEELKVEEDGQDRELLDQLVQRFTLHRIRDSMTSDLSPIMGYLRFVQAILTQEHPYLASLIAQTSNLPLFSLSWILTLTSHDLTSFAAISRLFDFLLCHDPIMICYLACAICLTKTEEVDQLVAEAEAEGGEVDLDMVHFVMSKLPVLSMTIDEDQIQGSRRQDDQIGVKKEETTASGSAGEADDQKPFVDSHSLDSARSSDQPSIPQDTFDARPQAADEEKPSVASQPVDSGISTNGSEKLGNLSHQCPASESKHQTPHRPRTISIEVLITSSLRLYERYPPTDARLGLDEILGPQSCVHTWAQSRSGALDDCQAEQILRGPLDQIVKPDRSELALKARQASLRRRAALMRKFRALITARNGVVVGSLMIGLVALALARREQGWSMSSLRNGGGSGWLINRWFWSVWHRKWGFLSGKGLHYCKIAWESPVILFRSNPSDVN